MRTARDNLVLTAHKAVIAAIRMRHLPRLSRSWIPCKDCGERATCYDHRDYYKPLEVSPVCRGCNNKRGPGLPLPTKEDGSSHKITWFKGGKKKNSWMTLGGGEGWTPLELICHANLDENPLPFSPPPRPGGISGWARAQYFKSHDPWRLNDASGLDTP